MKVLFTADYIFDSDYKVFSTIKTGYGYMVRDIMDEVSKSETVMLYTHRVTDSISKNYSVERHKIVDVLRSIRIGDCITGMKYLFMTGNSFSRRLHYWFYYLDKGAFLRVLKNNRPDIVHIHGATISSKVYVEACEELEIPYLLTLHGFNKNVKNVPVADRRCEYELLKKMQINQIPVTVVSSGIKKAIVNEYNLTGMNISVILNGVNPEQFLYHHQRINDNYTIVSIGNICERKNQLQLIRAVKGVSNSISIKVILCGGNPESINVQKCIQDSCMEDRIHYLGYVEHNDMGKVWSQADLNIVVSKVEGFGLSIVEGFGHGVPTLMFSDLDAVHDVYNPDAVELIYNRSDEDIVKGIERCYQRKWDKTKIMSFARNFSLEIVGSQYISLYKKTNEKKYYDKY